MKIDYSGKVVLITGGTRGIGKAMADVFYEAGATLILTGTNPDRIDVLNEQMKIEGKERVSYTALNLSDTNSVDVFLQFIGQLPRLDVCINNAGINRISDNVDTADSDFDDLVDINLKGPYRILKVVGRKMMAQNYGRVLNVASIWSVITRPGRSLYTTTKWGLVGLTKTLSVEWAPCNVLVNSISPGFTLTELTRNTNRPEQLDTLSEIIPMKRLAEPVEMANVAAFFCSDLNTYVTGQNITVDGGYTNV
jgi:3-oxoacyl-[acyl-carrier protein] reductase